MLAFEKEVTISTVSQRDDVATTVRINKFNEIIEKIHDENEDLKFIVSDPDKTPVRKTITGLDICQIVWYVTIINDDAKKFVEAWRKIDTDQRIVFIMRDKTSPF